MIDRITESTILVSDHAEDGDGPDGFRSAPIAARPSRGISEAFLAKLIRCLSEGLPADRTDVLDEMRRAGIADAEIADRYVPEIARRLGAAWMANARSFVDVSVLTAQLQSLLRELAGQTRQNPLAAGASPCIAVIVEAGEAHTLGAMVLSGQLRRHGVSVRQIVGRDHTEVAERIKTDPVDAVMISAARSEGLASLGRLVKKLRQSNGQAVPIVVGGPVLAYEDDLETKTGADFIASDAISALKALGLIGATRSNVLRAVPA